VITHTIYFNKLEISPKAFTLDFKSPLKGFSTLGGNFNHSKWLGVILHQMTMKVTIEALDLQEVPLHLLPCGLLNLWLVFILGIRLVPFSLVPKHLLELLDLIFLITRFLRPLWQ
jgi:hypothetical protein